MDSEPDTWDGFAQTASGARARIRELERELEQSFMTMAAIIAKHGETPPDHPERRVVRLTSADMVAAPSRVYRVDDLDVTTYGVRVDG